MRYQYTSGTPAVFPFTHDDVLVLRLVDGELEEATDEVGAVILSLGDVVELGDEFDAVGLEHALLEPVDPETPETPEQQKAREKAAAKALADAAKGAPASGIVVTEDEPAPGAPEAPSGAEAPPETPGELAGSSTEQKEG